MTHDIDCDMDEDCTCPAGEEEHEFPLCPDCGERHPQPLTMLVPVWFLEAFGLRPVPEVEHPELGHIEI